MEKVHPVEIETTGIDLEAIRLDEKPDDIFAREYGADVMDQAMNNQKRGLERASNRRREHAVDPGLKVGTNARLSFFESEKLYDNDWKNSTLDLVEEMLLQCQESSRAHTDAAKVCRRKHRMMMIPSIVLATAATSASFFAAGDNPCDEEGGAGDDEGLKYVVAVLTALVGIVSGIGSVYNFKAKMEAHVAAAASFANLARRCKIIVFLPIKLKPNSEVALTDISAEQAHLTNTSPLL